MAKNHRIDTDYREAARNKDLRIWLWDLPRDDKRANNPHDRLNLLLSALRPLILMFARVTTSSGAKGAEAEIGFFNQLMPEWRALIYNFRNAFQNAYKTERKVAGCKIIFDQLVATRLPWPLRNAVLDIFFVTHERALMADDWKLPGVHEGQLLLGSPKLWCRGDLSRPVRKLGVSINFGVNVESAPWTADLLFKNTVVPCDMPVTLQQEKKPRVEDQRLKNAHILLSSCSFPMYLDMVVRHYSRMEQQADTAQHN